MLDQEYQDKMDKMEQDDLGKDNVEKSLVITGENSHKINESLRNIEDYLVVIKDYINEQEDSGEDEKRKIINSMQIPGVRFRVVEYDSSYIGDLKSSSNIYFAQKLGMKLRSLEVDLKKGGVTMEGDMFQSSDGMVKLDQKFGPMHIFGGFFRKMNEETFFRPEFKGTGTVRMRSDFKFIHLMHISEETRIVLERGIYLASAGEWEYKLAKNFNVGMVFFSDKNLFQTELRGKGIVALELPVHHTELIKHVVTQDKPFKVSGEHVLYWEGNLERKIYPAKKLLGNLASGRGVLEEYTGEGYVYTAPTMGYYNKISSKMKGKNTGNTDPISDDADLGKKDKPMKDKFNFNSRGIKIVGVIVLVIVVYILFKIIF